MQILELKVLRGPNFWSIRWPNLIQMKLDLEELEERPTNTIHGFLERLKKLLPSMISHQCSEGVRGGFFMRVQDGTWMGHVVEHIALELQTLAGMDSGFGRTRSTGEREGVYYVSFGYLEEEAGLYTARAAVRIAQALIDGTDYNLEQDIQQLRKLRTTNQLPAAIETIVTEAAKRNIPCIRFNKKAQVQLGYGIHQKRIGTALSCNTSSIGMEITGDKEENKALHAAAGLPLQKAETVVDRLFPDHSDGRIPIIAITGTNGKTTTTLLAAHIARTAGKKVGYTTSEGIYVQSQQILRGNGTGLVPARFVLKDPTVDFAVLACSGDSILNEGLAFQQCRVAIVTNVTGDSTILAGNNAAEKTAKLKRVVPETVRKDGYAILNADDDLVYGMKEYLDCRIALFSMNPDNPRIVEHCKNGGKACVFENGFITFLKGNEKVRVMPAVDLPFTQGGKAICQIANILPAVLSTWTFEDISIDDIRQALLTFTPAVSLPPARFHFFQLNRCHFLAACVHAPDEMQPLRALVSQLDYSYKWMIISGTGRDEDMIALSAFAGQHFDNIVIQNDKTVNNRNEVEVRNHLLQGIQEVNVTKNRRALRNEEAIHDAYTHAPEGSLIVVVCDEVSQTIDTLKKLKEAEEKRIKKEIFRNLPAIRAK